MSQINPLSHPAPAPSSPTDPKAQSTLRQRTASDPAHPVWVGASAGSGKTKVLVDRLLRLMLPSNTHTACDPSRILCITFTKAAAAEVLARITHILSDWAITPNETLTLKLQELLNTPPTQQQIDIARALFARVLDAPGGMKIMTIHSFCQSVLARFPMEAGLPAGFEVMDDANAATLMRNIRRQLIISKSDDPKLESAFDFLSTHKDSQSIETLMETVFAQRTRLHMLLDNFNGIDNLCTAVYNKLSIPQNNPDSALQNIVNLISKSDLDIIGSQTKGRIKTYDKLIDDCATLAQNFDIDVFISTFLTTEFKKRVPPKDIKDNPQLLSIYNDMQTQAETLNNIKSSIITAQGTCALLYFSVCALNRYDAHKRKLNQFDFEDLITHTRALLSGSGIHWVQYKLDGGIDHILVDEAQDTNPDQWDIISALYAEFYDGHSRRDDLLRTTFIVGDEKQSIYSFQGADPSIFDKKRTELLDKTTAANTPQINITLNASFRSGASILSFVDTVFATAAMRQGVLQNYEQDLITHQAAFSGMPGYVEIWPIIKPLDKLKDTPDDTAWMVETNAPAALATRIAKTIRHWLDTNEILESYNRPIRPGDILILLAKRHPMAEPILRALRAENIPVTGIDRMVLSEQIAIQDVLAALSFALNPDDDLTLATLLKSPFIRMDEETLFTLAHNRPSTLWDNVRKTGSPTSQWLESLIEKSASYNAGAFLHHIYYTPCPQSPVSGLQALLTGLGSDAIDPLQELLARADAQLISTRTGLQEFLQSALTDTTEIKRQIDPTDNRVRLMTVHGSKGLEAPIVFLPDTLRRKSAANKAADLQFPARDDTTTPPLWSPSSDTRAPALNDMREHAKILGEEEYRRLLYVALTRPATRLYIAAAQSGTDNSYTEQSWYHNCAAAITAMPECQTNASDPKILYIKNDRTSDPKPERDNTAANTNTQPLPQWAHSAAPDVEFPPRPLMPSRIDDDTEPAALSPLSGNNTLRFKRGLIIHTLLQFLPDIAPHLRRARAHEFLSSPTHNLTPGQIADITKALFDVLENPNFVHLFDEYSRAEVPITGKIGHNIISGQIDRLRIDDTSITILDYKTNRPGAQTPDDVARAYKNQLRLYRDLLSTLYPQKTIKSYLLWTDGPTLMDMTLDL